MIDDTIESFADACSDARAICETVDAERRTLAALAAAKVQAAAANGEMAVLHPREYEALRGLGSAEAQSARWYATRKSNAQLLYAFATARLVSLLAIAGMTGTNDTNPVAHKRLRGWGQ